MGKALYREFRPTSFDEVIGQDHITTTLKNSLQSGSVGHAYLLTGPRGVGKTSIARILAYAVNNVPYDKDGSHLDIIEIDAASNRRIDEIRSLREKVHIAPTSGKYKVYIIDEVHMLTREAFNALLKTLEEPPAHVIFILATTEIHKLPDTIVSRCITFTFRPIDQSSVIDHLQHIASSEGFKITQDALALLAIHGEGSFRDSISLLDQVKNPGSEVTVEDIQLALGLASDDRVIAILTAVEQGDAAALALALEQAYLHGATETNISKQVGKAVRDELLNKTSRFSSEDALQLLSDLLTVAASPKPRAKLELALLEQLFKGHPTHVAAAASTPSAPVPKTKPVVTVTVDPTPTPAPTPKPIVAATKAVATPAPVQQTATVTVEASQDLWNDLLKKLRTQNNTLYGIARMAQAEHRDGKLFVTFKFPFHYKQVTQVKNKSIIMTLLDSLGHGDVELVADLKTDADVKKAEAAKPAEDPLSSINNIFGDGEVLES